MIIRWNLRDILDQIRECTRAATDPRQDGFSTWRYKQDLYQIKFAVDEALKKCSTYTPEDEWLEQCKKEKMWKELRKI